MMDVRRGLGAAPPCKQSLHAVPTRARPPANPPNILSGSPPQALEPSQGPTGGRKFPSRPNAQTKRNRPGRNTERTRTRTDTLQGITQTQMNMNPDMHVQCMGIAHLYSRVHELIIRKCRQDASFCSSRKTNTNTPPDTVTAFPPFRYLSSKVLFLFNLAPPQKKTTRSKQNMQT